MTLDAWFEQNEELKLLRKNLETNMQVLASELMTEEEMESLIRTNLIMIRQCIENLKLTR